MVDTKLIPKGAYCHGPIIYNEKTGKLETEQMCPYWAIENILILHRNEAEAKRIAGEYNDSLYKGMRCEHADTCSETCHTAPETKCKTLIVRCKYLDKPYDEGESLLWDQVKECGINDDDCFD